MTEAAEDREELMRAEDESLLDETDLEFVRLFTEFPDIPTGSLISEAERREQQRADQLEPNLSPEQEAWLRKVCGTTDAPASVTD